MTTATKYSLWVLVSALAGAAGLITTEIVVRTGLTVVDVAIVSNTTGGVLLLAWAAARGTTGWGGWSRGDVVRLVAGAASTFALGFVLLYEAVALIGTGKTSLLGRLETIFIVLLAVVFFGESWTRRHWLAGLLALIGSVLVNFDPGAFTLEFGPGELVAIASAFVFAGGIIVLKSVLNRHAGLLVTGYGLLIGAAILMLSRSGGVPDVSLVMGLVLVARGSMLALSWITYNVAMQHIGASRCSVVFLGMAFMAIVLQLVLDAAAPQLGLKPPRHLGLAITGGLVICSGIWLLSRLDEEDPATAAVVPETGEAAS